MFTGEKDTVKSTLLKQGRQKRAWNNVALPELQQEIEFVINKKNIQKEVHSPKVVFPYYTIRSVRKKSTPVHSVFSNCPLILTAVFYEYSQET